MEAVIVYTHRVEIQGRQYYEIQHVEYHVHQDVDNLQHGEFHGTVPVAQICEKYGRKGIDCYSYEQHPHIFRMVGIA